jgi:hypothetical protein
MKFNHNQKYFRQVLVTIILFVIAYFFGFSDIKKVSADRLESDSYVIQFGNFNMTSGEKNSTSYNLTDTVGQSLAGPFGAYGSSSYFLGAGFQYIYQIESFTFSISDLNIPLGLLTPDTHASGSNTLSINTKGAGGFAVYAYQTNPLRNQDGVSEIPNTTCDNGNCDISTANIWTNQLVPGFGYNANGSTAPSDFVNSTYYRPFANNEISEPMQIVMSSSSIAQSELVDITYKAGISGIQAAGNYQTSIVYIAVPGF